MANTLTGLIPIIYEGMYQASRELIGFIPAVSRDSRADKLAIGQTARVPVGVAGDAEDIVPGATPASSGDTTLDYIDVSLDKAKAVPIRWTGEEQLSVNGMLNTVLVQQFADGFRKLGNAIELDIATAAYKAASRAYGTAGTTPFGTAGDLSDFAGVNKILDDNGAPQSGRQLVLNTASIANLRGKQSVLFKVNEAGSSDMLRDGMTDRVQGLALRQSAGLSQHVKGTATGALVNVATTGEVAGQTTITLDTITAGATGIKAGDVVTFAGDSNKYVVRTGLVGASGNIVLNDGLLQTAADDAAMTIGNSFTPNVAFTSDAVALLARAPASPDGGDMADDRTFVTDPYSGLTFEVSIYRQYRQVKIEIAMAWGVGIGNREHVALLLG